MEERDSGKSTPAQPGKHPDHPDSIRERRDSEVVQHLRQDYERLLGRTDILDNAVDARRYRDALERIWLMMGPQNSEHTKSCISCEGCLFEWEETLQVVRNVLDGKEPDDHWEYVERPTHSDEKG